MEEKKIDGYILQGANFLIQPTITFRAQIDMIDPIDPEILEHALHETLDSKEYYMKKLCEKDDGYVLLPNSKPCLVYYEDRVRRIPDETNGYLFYFSYRDSSIFFTFNHFLMDGMGYQLFTKQILKAYCNLKYHTDFTSGKIHSAKTYFEERVLPYYKEAPVSGNSADFPKQVPSLPEAQTLLSINKKNLVEVALKKNVKPFSFLAYVCAKAMGEYIGKRQVTFRYSANVRNEIGVPDAIYNCFTVFQDVVDTNADPSKELIHLNQQIISNLTTEKKLETLAYAFKSFRDIIRNNDIINERNRVAREIRNEKPTELFLSYLGNFSGGDEEGDKLSEYVNDYQIWGLEGSTTLLMIIDVVTVRNRMNLCLRDRVIDNRFCEILKKHLENEGINICSIESGIESKWVR